MIAGLITAVGLGNLCLIGLLVRWQRVQDTRLASRARPRPVPVLSVGEPAPGFMVTTVDGTVRSLADMRGDRGVIAFLTPDGEACLARVPDLVEYAAAHPRGARSVIAVITAQDGARRTAATRLAAELRPAVSVVIEPLDGPMQRAYAVPEHPYFYVIRANGRITGRGSYIEAFNGAHLRVLA
ncbi:MAG: TlpA family protein disulfide reductase [Trebonia sp.]